MDAMKVYKDFCEALNESIDLAEEKLQLLSQTSTEIQNALMDVVVVDEKWEAEQLVHATGSILSFVKYRIHQVKNMALERESLDEVKQLICLYALEACVLTEKLETQLFRYYQDVSNDC